MKTDRQQTARQIDWEFKREISDRQTCGFED